MNRRTFLQGSVATLALGLARRQLYGLAVVGAVETPTPVLTPRQRHGDTAIDGGAQHGASVVVGVVADKLDSTRRAGDDLRRAAKDFLELGGDDGCAHGGGDQGKPEGSRARRDDASAFAVPVASARLLFALP